MNKTLAKLLSFLAHPMLVLTWVALLLMAMNPYVFGVRHWTDQRAILLVISVFSTTFLIPGVGVAMMKPLGLIKSLQMHDKQERTGPYIVTGVFYLWMFKNLASGGIMPDLFAVCVLGATIGLFFAFFINIFTKISAHATGMGGLVAMLVLACVQWPGVTLNTAVFQLSSVALLALAVLLAGWVGMARLALNAHTPPDLYRGYAAGVLAVFIAAALL
jgi:hypothetical protein